jgi:hypothetical protein
MKIYGEKAYTALAYEMNDEFSRVLHQQMEYFSTNRNVDTLNRVKGELNEVRFSINYMPIYIYSGWQDRKFLSSISIVILDICHDL